MTTQTYVPPRYVPSMDDVRKLRAEIEKDSGVKVTKEQIKFAMDGALEMLTIDSGVIYEIEGKISEAYGLPREENPPTEFTHDIDVYRNARVWAMTHDFDTIEYDIRVASMTNAFNSIPIKPSSGTSIRGS